MRIKIQHRKLGKEKSWGLAHLEDNLVELDSRLTGRRHLLYLLHEILHIMHPDWSETKVVQESRILCKILWKQRYRRVEVT